jgi:hypothetical protein
MRACELGKNGALFESKSMESVGTVYRYRVLTNAMARERVDGREGVARAWSGWVLASRQAVHLRRNGHKLRKWMVHAVVNRRDH